MRGARPTASTPGRPCMQPWRRATPNSLSYTACSRFRPMPNGRCVRALVAGAAWLIATPAQADVTQGLRLFYRCEGGEWLPMRIGSLDCSGTYALIPPMAGTICEGDDCLWSLEWAEWRRAQAGHAEWGVSRESAASSGPFALDDEGCRRVWRTAYPNDNVEASEYEVQECVRGSIAWRLWLGQILRAREGEGYANLILHLASAPGFGWPDGAPPPVAPQPAK